MHQVLMLTENYGNERVKSTSAFHWYPEVLLAGLLTLLHAVKVVAVACTAAVDEVSAPALDVIVVVTDHLLCTLALFAGEGAHI